jgi:predicted PurR-regulated permease PerM
MVLAPFAIALLLALLINPAIARLERRGISRRWSVLIISLAFLVIFAGIALYLIPVIVRQIMTLPDFVKGLPETFSRYHHRWDAFVDRLRVPQPVQDAIAEAGKKAQGAMPKALASLGGSLARSVGFVIWIVLIPIFTIYLLADLDNIGKRAIYLVPSRLRERAAQLGNEIGGVFLGWARGMAIVSTVNGVLVGIALAVLGVPYSLIVGLLAILLYPVPYIGPWLTVLIAFFTALAGVGIVKALIAVGIVVLLNQIFDTLITPRVVGGKVGLHPVVSLIALMVGAQLFGIVGMLLALPIAATIQILLVHAIPRLGSHPSDE